MAKRRRFTVRLEDREIASIKNFADENRVVTSVAVRRLLAVGLAMEKRTPPLKTAATGPQGTV